MRLHPMGRAAQPALAMSPALACRIVRPASLRHGVRVEAPRETIQSVRPRAHPAPQRTGVQGRLVSTATRSTQVSSTAVNRTWPSTSRQV